MKALHFIMGKANKNRANGVNQVIHGLVKYMARSGLDVTVLGKASSAKFQGEVVAYPDFSVVVFSKAGPSFWRRVAQEIQAHDIVHLHGVFNMLNILIGWMCRHYKTPYIVTLHDGLAPERMRKRFWLKLIFSNLFQKSFLRQAGLLHALTREEQTTAIQFLGEPATIVIENGIDREDFQRKDLRSAEIDQDERHPITFGYLGRISREKNLHALVAAFEKFTASRNCSDRPVRLYIAGPRNSKIERSFKPKENIAFVGPKFGQSKVAFLNSIDWFVHPSLCDVFSIAAMEAMASGTPLIISRLSDASYYAQSNAFVMCEPTVAGLLEALETASLRMPERDTYILRGQNLIDSIFNWQTASARMLNAYRALIRD